MTHSFAITFLSEAVETEWGNVPAAREAAATSLRYFQALIATATGGSGASTVVPFSSR
ncbi:MAG: hypothetical protein ACE5EF_01380 [Dehalococcoidia bacterium]